jgi:S1-C subfamily serine protease
MSFISVGATNKRNLNLIVGDSASITPPASGFSVLNSTGTAFAVSRNVLDSTGASFTVPANVLDSTGASFTPI